MSLVRDTDGSLLYCARGADLPNNRDFHLWRSTDNGQKWEYVLRAMMIHSGAPVTLNQAADGTPYFVANLLEPLLISTVDHRKVPISNYWRDRYRSTGRWLMMCGHRRKLYLWPLHENCQDLETPILVRDGETDFGQEPRGDFWCIDHPIGLTVRPADGQWHHVLSYRVLGGYETAAQSALTPRTGCYVEQVFSKGPVKPVWYF